MANERDRPCAEKPSVDLWVFPFCHPLVISLFQECDIMRRPQSVAHYLVDAGRRIFKHWRHKQKAVAGKHLIIQPLHVILSQWAFSLEIRIPHGPHAGLTVDTRLDVQIHEIDQGHFRPLVLRGLQRRAGCALSVLIPAPADNCRDFHALISLFDFECLF